MTRHSPLAHALRATLVVAATLALPASAWADELNVSLSEDDGGVTLRVRGVPQGSSHDQIVTSKDGALVFVTGAEVSAQRLRPMAKHRLNFVQLGRAGERVAVRVVQRKAARGSLSKHMHATDVPGGFDLRIEDDDAPTPAAPIHAAAIPADFDREARRAQLAADTSPPTAVTVGAVTPTLATPVAPLAPAAPPVATAGATPREPASADTPRAFDDDAVAPKWAGTNAESPLPLQRSAPQIGLAWLATALLAFSGMGLLWWRRRRPMMPGIEAMQIVSRVSIGPKQQLLWLSAGGRALLLGATEHRIELIADLTPAPASSAAGIIHAAGPNQASAANAAPGKVAAFKQRLRAALGDEVAGRSDEPVLPPHLEILAGDPRLVGRKDAA